MRIFWSKNIRICWGFVKESASERRNPSKLIFKTKLVLITKPSSVQRLKYKQKYFVLQNKINNYFILKIGGVLESPGGTTKSQVQWRPKAAGCHH
jgi:hypothetical protein